MYGLVSVQGFRTHAEGEALRKKIVEIGRQVPGGGTRGWSDAFFSRVAKAAAG
jgi:hypothetical protein